MPRAGEIVKGSLFFPASTESPFRAKLRSMVTGQGARERQRSTRMARLAAVFLGALALSPIVLPGNAEADPILQVGAGDVRVEAEKLEVDVAAQTAVLTGKVLLAKGDLHLHLARTIVVVPFVEDVLRLLRRARQT